MVDEKDRYRNLSGPRWREMAQAERAVVIALSLFVAIFGWCILLGFGYFIAGPSLS